MAREPLIDRSFLEKLERLAMRWQASFRGRIGGHNLSKFSGPGQEFLDHRHFHEGDDVRAVNWRAYLRFEKLFLKIFRVEPHIPIRLMVDTSASMGTGDGAKFEYARKLAAALCYVGLVNLDSITLQPFAGSLADPLACAGGRHKFAPAVEFLEKLEARGKTDYLGIVRQFIPRYSQRGLLIVVSDFLDDGGCEDPLQYLADFGHELMLVQLWAEEDRTPPWEGDLELADSETGARLRVEFDSRARESYTAAFDEYSRRIRRLALRNGGRYAGLSTAVPIEEAIFGTLARAGAVE